MKADGADDPGRKWLVESYDRYLGKYKTREVDMTKVDPGVWTEDDPEVQTAARALAEYYENDASSTEEWMAGALVALNASVSRVKVRDER
jgi:hypothetical protein